MFNAKRNAIFTEQTKLSMDNPKITITVEQIQSKASDTKVRWRTSSKRTYNFNTSKILNKTQEARPPKTMSECATPISLYLKKSVPPKNIPLQNIRIFSDEKNKVDIILRRACFCYKWPYSSHRYYSSTVAVKSK